MIGDVLQPTHLLLILVVALLVLGPKRLPEVGRSLGKGIRDFRGAMSGIQDETHDIFDQATVPMPAPEPIAAPTLEPEPVPAPRPEPEPVMAASSASEHTAVDAVAAPQPAEQQ